MTPRFRTFIMGLLTILKKLKEKEREMRLLMLCVGGAGGEGRRRAPRSSVLTAPAAVPGRPCAAGWTTLARRRF